VRPQYGEALVSRHEYLFSSNDLRAVLDGQRSRMRGEIDAMDGNRLLNTAPADLANYFVQRSQLTAPTLDRDQMTAHEEETRVDVSGDRDRYWSRDIEGPRYIAGQRIQVEVPFSGDHELFFCRASTYSSMPPRGAIRDGKLLLTWDIAHDRTVELRPEVDRLLAEIEQHLTWVRGDVNGFNASLPNEASSAIEGRRKRLLANQGRLVGLGIPVKARQGVPTTYAAPAVRKKIVPQLPAASTAAYTPEPVLDEQLYDHILNVVQNMAHVMERSPSAFIKMDEESLRQHFLVQLNGQFEGQATGETFNVSGKTDILLRSGDRNVFIAECKFWKGPKQFGETIDQLLGYASWRDSKTAIFVFNRDTAATTVLQGVRSEAERHANYKRTLAWKHESGFRFVFHQPGDPNRELLITVLVFDIPTNR
jgi:hypothetical protein